MYVILSDDRLEKLARDEMVMIGCGCGGTCKRCIEHKLDLRQLSRGQLDQFLDFIEDGMEGDE